jgi:hypothetical protein
MTENNVSLALTLTPQQKKLIANAKYYQKVKNDEEKYDECKRKERTRYNTDEDFRKKRVQQVLNIYYNKKSSQNTFN